MSEISGAKPKCTACKKNLYRDYQSENAVVAEEPRTIGSLADKNSSRMSDDHKSYLKEKYKSKNKRKNINYGERN